MLRVKINLGTTTMWNLNIGMDIELGIVIDQGMVMEIRVGDKEMVMVRNMVLEIRKDKGRVYGASGTQSHTHYTTYKGKETAKYTPSRGIGGGQRGDDRNGGDKGNGDRKKYRSTKYDFEDVDEEERDTEDSFELEITPQQLNQVTPGGGVLKLTLSKKKPLKITTGAPSGEPDPSQTTVKTVYDPREEKGDQSVRGTNDIAQTELGQLRKEGALPIGGREPPQKDENRRSDRHPGEKEGPDDKGSKGNGNGNGRPHGNGKPDGNGNPNGGGNSDGNGRPARRGEEPPGRNGEPVMMMGMEMGPPLPHQILPHLEEDIGPDLFMYY